MPIHASDIRLHKDCPRKYKYAKVMGLRPKGPQRALDPGTGAHEALAAYYRGELDPRTEDGLAEFFKQWCEENIYAKAGDEGLDEKIVQEIDNIYEVLRLYPHYAAQNDDFKVLQYNGQPLVEIRFSVPLFDEDGRVVDTFDGRIDAIVQDEWGHLWILEHKTLAQFPNARLLELDEQCGLYLLAASKLFPELRIRGVLYNVLRKTDPRKAKTAVFQRFQVTRATSELRFLEWNLMASLEEIKRDQTFLPRPGLVKCPSCSYFTLCISENQGVDIQPLVESMYEVVKPQEEEEAHFHVQELQ